MSAEGDRGHDKAKEGKALGDCMGCRLTGLLFGTVGSMYMGSHLLSTPPPTGAHRLGIILAAGAVFSLGMYRAIG
jgi:hypothetical protein